MIISMNFHAFFSFSENTIEAFGFFRWGMLKISENLGAKKLNDGDAY